LKAYLALYDGAYGKTIRIETRDKTSLKKLYESFRMLGEGKNELRIINGQKDNRYNVKVLELRIGPKEEINVAGSLNNLTITWFRDREGWHYVKDLIAALLTADENELCEQDIDTDDYFIEIEWKPDTGVV
jgi:hypothetical protein